MGNRCSSSRAPPAGLLMKIGPNRQFPHRIVWGCNGDLWGAAKWSLQRWENGIKGYNHSLTINPFPSASIPVYMLVQTLEWEQYIFTRGYTVGADTGA
ncbi:hypothetical protein FKM82_021307 [Ascaphus truei]